MSLFRSQIPFLRDADFPSGLPMISNVPLSPDEISQLAAWFREKDSPTGHPRMYIVAISVYEAHLRYTEQFDRLQPDA